MSKSRKRIAAEEDEDEEDLWSEEEEETAKKPKKRTKQSFIDDVVGDDDDGGGGGAGGGAASALEEIDDGYDSDMYGDDADRAYLDGLPELQREIILDERRSKRKEMQERREALSKAAGRSAVTPATRGSTRTAAGRRGAALPYSAIEDLIARRTKANATKQSESVVFDEDDADEEMAVDDDEDEDDDRRPKGRKRATAQRRKKRDSVSVMEAAEEADEDQAAEAEGENDAEAAEEKARQREEARFSIPGSHTPLRLSDMKMLQLRRDRLERIYEEPWLADVVKGMFVRVGVGPDSKGVAKYRVGEVARSEDMKSKYPFPPGSVNRSTRLGLVLRYGDLERTWSMAAISNQSITDDEFSDWTSKMKRANLPTPTAEEALERKKRAEFLKETYVYTPEQVARMVAEKRGRGKQLNVTLERTELEMELAKARAAVQAVRARLKGRGRVEQKEREEDEVDEDERRRSDQRQLEDEERRIEQIDNKLSELKEIELKQQKTAKARPEMSNILTVNKRNAENDIATMRDMFIQHEREKRDEEEQLRREGKTRIVVLDPFKRKATRPQTQFEAEDEVKQEAQKEEEKDEVAAKEAQARAEAQQRSEEAARKRLTHLTHLTQLTQRTTLGSGPLAFPKPPSLSDQLLAQLVLEHKASKERVDVTRQGGGLGLLGAAGRSEGGGRVADSKYTHLPAGERVLTVGEYWRRREQA